MEGGRSPALRLRLRPSWPWRVGPRRILAPAVAGHLFPLFSRTPHHANPPGGTSPGDRVYPKTCNYCIRLYPRL